MLTFFFQPSIYDGIRFGTCEEKLARGNRTRSAYKKHWRDDLEALSHGRAFDWTVVHALYMLSKRNFGANVQAAIVCTPLREIQHSAEDAAELNVLRLIGDSTEVGNPLNERRWMYSGKRAI